MKLLTYTTVLCLTVVALGCGQKGPLVLPDAPAHKHKRINAPPPAAPPPPTTPGGPSTGSGT